MGGRQPVRDEKKLRGGALTVMQKQPMLGVCQFYREPEDKHAENKKCTQQLNVHLQKDDTNASLFSSCFTLFAYTHDTEQSTTTICCQSTTFRLWNPSQILTNGEKPKILFLWPVSLLHFLLLHLYTKNEPLVFKSMTSGADVLSIVSHALHYFYSVREVVSNVSGAKPMKGELKSSTNTQKSLCSQRVVHTGTRRFHMKAPNLHADGGWSRHQVNWDPWAQISFIKPL